LFAPGEFLLPKPKWEFQKY